MRSTKSEWFSRLRSGAGGKASRKRPPVLGGHAPSDRASSLTRFTTALKLWLLSTLPVIQLARSAPSSKSTPPGKPPASPAPAGDSAYQQELLENLKADTELKRLQAQALKDEHELQTLKRRAAELDAEKAEIQRGLTLLAVVIIGAILVAGTVIGIADPSLNQPGSSWLELCKLLLG